MKDLVLLMAGVMSKEDLVNQLKSSIQEYELNPSDDEFKKVTVSASLILAKASIDLNDGTDAEKISAAMESFDKTEKAHNLLNPEKQ